MPTTRERLARHDAAIKRLARVGEISHADAAPAASAQFVVGEATACLPLGTLIDLKAEEARLQKELAKVTEEIARLHKKLSNEKFVANAPEEWSPPSARSSTNTARRRRSSTRRYQGFASEQLKRPRCRCGTFPAYAADMPQRKVPIAAIFRHVVAIM